MAAPQFCSDVLTVADVMAWLLNLGNCLLLPEPK